MGVCRRITALGIIAGLMSAFGCISTPAPEVRPLTSRAQESAASPPSPTFPAPPENLEQGRGPIPESTPSVANADTPLPINLASALQLAGARPLDVQIAGRQVEAAAAVYDRSKLLWVPNLVLGVDYFGHLGLQQNFVGEIVKSNRNSFMAGLGPNVVFAFSDAVYAPLAAKQDLRARQAREQATINDVSLDVAAAYFTVQQARGELAGALLAVKFAEDLVTRAAALGKGLAPPQEEARAKVELARRRLAAIAARERWRVASAELARILRLDAAAVIEPLEPPFLPVTIIDPTVPVDGLIPIALTARPELASNQALVEATLARLKQEKLRPLVPSLAVRSVSTNPSGSLGYGVFGGTGNEFRSHYGNRFDIDVQLLWEFQAFGLANKARVGERKAEHASALLELFRTQDLIAAEVVQAFAQVRAAAERLNEAEPALREARDLMDRSIEGLGQTRRVGDSLLLVIRPQEAVAAVQAFAQANTDFYAAVADYNRAQFRLYRALGHPAQCLARAVPGGEMIATEPQAVGPQTPRSEVVSPQPPVVLPPVVEVQPAPSPAPRSGMPTPNGGIPGLVPSRDLPMAAPRSEVVSPQPPVVLPPVVEVQPAPSPAPRSVIPSPTGGIPGQVPSRELPVVTPREGNLTPRTPAVPVPPAIWADDPKPPVPVVPSSPRSSGLFPTEPPAVPAIPPGGAYRAR